MRNSTASATSFIAWAVRLAARSASFQRELDRLRRLAAGETRSGYPRTTGVLSDQPWPELERTLADSLRLDQSERLRAWRHTPLPTDDGLRHLRSYLRGCRKLSRIYLGSEQAAPLVHELVGRHGYTASAPALGPRAPTGAKASTLAAHISGASWGSGATANRQAWYRARPRHLTFEL